MLPVIENMRVSHGTLEGFEHGPWAPTVTSASRIRGNRPRGGLIEKPSVRLSIGRPSAEFSIKYLAETALKFTLSVFVDNT